MLVACLQYWMKGTWRDPLVGPFYSAGIQDVNGVFLAVGSHVQLSGILQSFSFTDPQHAQISVLADLPTNAPVGQPRVFVIDSLCVTKI